jgi:hypothetical protein
MSASQLLDWIAYYAEEPFGFDYENFRFGLITSAVYNVNRQNANSKVFEPLDFFKKHDEKQSEKEMIAKLDSIFMPK